MKIKRKISRRRNSIKRNVGYHNNSGKIRDVMPLFLLTLLVIGRPWDFDYGRLKPAQGDWKLDEMIDIVNSSLMGIPVADGQTNLIIISDLPTITQHSFQYYFRDINIFQIDCFTMGGITCIRNHSYIVKNAEIIILSDIKERNDFQGAVYSTFLADFENVREQYILLETFQLPENYSVQIFKRKDRELG